MIESLKNTCVLPESQEQARVIVALYEAAGGKIWVDSSLPEWDKENPIGLWRDGDIIHADLVGSQTQRITFDELCWNYGIGPDWAKALVEWGGEYFWRGDELGQSLKTGIVFEYSKDGLVARGEPLSTRPSEQPKRKTLQDALEAFPDGVPINKCTGKPYNYLIYFEQGQKFVWMEHKLIDQCKMLVFTREEYEEAHAKRMAEKEWPASGALPPVGEECLFIRDPRQEKDCIVEILVTTQDGWVGFMHKSGANFPEFVHIDVVSFRPIQSERDRLIEQAAKQMLTHEEGETDLVLGYGDYLSLAKCLYDDGMLKDPKQ